MTDQELLELVERWELTAQKRESQAGKLAREGAAQASAYSSGVSAGLSVAANDVRGTLKGRKPL